jgi:hypothetical protein
MKPIKLDIHGLVILGCIWLVGACGGRATPAATVPGTPVAPPAPLSAATAGDTLALGSRSNPVQAHGPFGEREYLRRLVCPGGASPTFGRYGSVGSGGDGHILDVYGVQCPNGELNADVYMDMYHGEHRERRTIAGFGILPELPARLATGCPPQVGPTPDSSARYVFNYLEVATPARVLNLPVSPIVAGVEGYASVGFIVDTTGRPEPASIEVDSYVDAKIRPVAQRAALDLRFTPAEHHPGCRVRQGTGVELRFR